MFPMKLERLPSIAVLPVTHDMSFCEKLNYQRFVQEAFEFIDVHIGKLEDVASSLNITSLSTSQSSEAAARLLHRFRFTRLPRRARTQEFAIRY